MVELKMRTKAGFQRHHDIWLLEVSLQEIESFVPQVPSCMERTNLFLLSKQEAALVAVDILYKVLGLPALRPPSKKRVPRYFNLVHLLTWVGFEPVRFHRTPRLGF